MTKIHIDNRTNLPLNLIAKILDQWNESSYGETNYIGKLYGLFFDLDNERYQMDIVIRKTCLVVVVVSKGKIAV